MTTGSILMLEYDEDDQYITRQFFQDNYPLIKVDIVSTSEEFLQHLSGRKSVPSSLPSVILLNYHSTPKTAPELLRELKNEPELRQIPVIVLSGTSPAEIVDECYAAGANSFIQKPSLMNDTNEKIRSFIQYWFSTVELAQGSR
jgi:CheY-like chemotaxis protein